MRDRNRRDVQVEMSEQPLAVHGTEPGDLITGGQQHVSRSGTAEGHQPLDEPITVGDVGTRFKSCGELRPSAWRKPAWIRNRDWNARTPERPNRRQGASVPRHRQEGGSAFRPGAAGDFSAECGRHLAQRRGTGQRSRHLGRSTKMKLVFPQILGDSLHLSQPLSRNPQSRGIPINQYFPAGNPGAGPRVSLRRHGMAGLSSGADAGGGREMHLRNWLCRVRRVDRTRPGSTQTVPGGWNRRACARHHLQGGCSPVAHAYGVSVYPLPIPAGHPVRTVFRGRKSWRCQRRAKI